MLLLFSVTYTYTNSCHLKKCLGCYTKGLGNTIKEKNTTFIQEKAKAMIFLRRHLHEGLKAEYLTVNDPLVLWNSLKERYEHQRTVILPKARYDWMHLRLQYFKSVSEYNSTIFRISSQLQLCGEKNY